MTVCVSYWFAATYRVLELLHACSRLTGLVTNRVYLPYVKNNTKGILAN